MIIVSQTAEKVKEKSKNIFLNRSGAEQRKTAPIPTA